MITDRELLQRYARDASEEAFEEIVRRHVNLVYGTALRQLCGNGTLAEDVTQAVFTALAANRDAASRIRQLSAWLYTTTRFTVSHTVRAERRRQDREQKAYTMLTLLADSGNIGAPQFPSELLDQALEHLDDTDREAILLRFFAGQSFAAIGQTLAVSEDAARMRVARALERIRCRFAKNGITSSTSALGAALTQQAMAAPANLAAGAATAALAGAAVLTADTGSKLGILTFMTTTKTITWTAAAAAIVVLGYGGFRQRENKLINEQNAPLQANQQRAQQEVHQVLQRATPAERPSAQLEQRAIELQQTIQKPRPPTRSTRLASPGNTPSVAEKTLRMAQMKPLLEAGAPIKGVVIVLVDGKPVQRPVAFVMGHETRIDGIDDGAYVFTPTLNSDGSVKYAIRSEPGEAGGDELSFPNVTQTPWEGFTITGRGGRVFAFDHDLSTPSAL